MVDKQSHGENELPFREKEAERVSESEKGTSEGGYNSGVVDQGAAQSSNPVNGESREELSPSDGSSKEENDDEEDSDEDEGVISENGDDNEASRSASFAFDDREYSDITAEGEPGADTINDLQSVEGKEESDSAWSRPHREHSRASHAPATSPEGFSIPATHFYGPRAGDILSHLMQDLLSRQGIQDGDMVGAFIAGYRMGQAAQGESGENANTRAGARGGRHFVRTGGRASQGEDRQDPPCPFETPPRRRGGGRGVDRGPPAAEGPRVPRYGDLSTLGARLEMRHEQIMREYGPFRLGDTSPRQILLEQALRAEGFTFFGPTPRQRGLVPGDSSEAAQGENHQDSPDRGHSSDTRQGPVDREAMGQSFRATTKPERVPAA